MEQAGPTPMWIKIQEGYLGSEESQTHARPPSPAVQFQEDKSPQLLAAKPVGNESVGKTFWSPKQFLLKNPCTDSPTQTHTLWAPAPGSSLKGTPVVYREQQKCLESG